MSGFIFSGPLGRLIKSSVLSILIILISTLFYIPVDAQNLLKVHKKEAYMPKQSHFKAYSFQVDGECYIRVIVIMIVFLLIYSELAVGVFDL